MPEQLSDKVAFDFIRYANCWEDADVLLQALAVPEGSRILSIASAGDNSFSLLTKHPSLIVAVDVNENQLHLVALKKACFKTLTHDEMLEFLGFRQSVKRKILFEKVKPVLEASTLNYWCSQQELIELGVINTGKFERYFGYFCKKLLPFIHSKKTIAGLFTLKTAEEQKQYYEKRWNTWRWRLLFKLFFSRRVMGRYGRDPEFLKQVKINVSTFIFNQAQKQMSGIQAFDNFILRYNLTASFGGLLPHYMRPEHFEVIKNNIDKLVLKKAYAGETIDEFGSFDAMNLSNIFEYLDEKTFKNVSENLVNGLAPGGRLAYWNLMVPRRISEILPEALVFNEKLSKELHETDKGFFYSSFITETKNQIINA